MKTPPDKSGNHVPRERDPWLRPGRWIELLLLAWAIGVGFHYYRAMGFFDLVRDMLGGGS